MCEYCGCQAVTTIGELTREHDLVVDLIGDARSAHTAGDTAAMTAIARRIADVLGPHTAVEEHGLFPAMAEEFPEQIAALEAEHRRIEAVLGEAADGTPADPGWPLRLLDTLNLLRAHILKEQDGVFPAALAGLSTEDWEAVEAVRARVGTLLQADDGQPAPPPATGRATRSESVEASRA
ncbi:hemerythrin domain-containing protein [Streptosporangium pseudovulgare]|uniref:Hemerythrin n=1 Tax=Streptosporangium pseudovulgare TaxID=35765 RepID=A0ABQ2R0E6_9ACTN|nr:hemerythrin domain-containing protein [Streptosporangium pseudovulgare]GGQ06667.1 hemerythrin [Streptosporangium pseudovulgare]